MFDWNDVRCLLAVHRTGTLSRAARLIKVNQSTVSRRITALEEALGARLLEHEADRYVLSELGASLLSRMERMEEEAFAVEREAQGREASLSGSVRLTAPDALGSRFVPQLLAEFRGRYPEIDLELVSDNRTLNLYRREADLALRLATPTEPNMIVRKVAEVGNCVYAAKTYLARRGIPGESFEGHDFIGFDETFQPGATSRWFTEHANSARWVLLCNSTHAILAAAKAGMGLAVLPCYLGDADPELERISTPGSVISQTLYMVVHPDLRNTARVRALSEFLATAIAEREPLLRGSSK